MRQEPTSCLQSRKRKGSAGSLPSSFVFLFSSRPQLLDGASHIKDGSSMPTLLLGK